MIDDDTLGNLNGDVFTPGMFLLRGCFYSGDSMYFF